MVLTVNQAALCMIVFGLVLICVEALLPSFGVVGAGGLIALLVGMAIMVDAQGPGIAVSAPLLLAIAVLGVILLVIVTSMAIRARRRKLVGFDSALMGSVATVSALREDNPCAGWVHLQGEQWQVLSASPLQTGQPVRVLARRGVQLEVAAAETPLRQGD
jgi:membrane-bound serine protease (ClpP class)